MPHLWGEDLAASYASAPSTIRSVSAVTSARHMPTEAKPWRGAWRPTPPPVPPGRATFRPLPFIGISLPPFRLHLSPANKPEDVRRAMWAEPLQRFHRPDPELSFRPILTQPLLAQPERPDLGDLVHGRDTFSPTYQGGTRRLGIMQGFYRGRGNRKAGPAASLWQSLPRTSASLPPAPSAPPGSPMRQHRGKGAAGGATSTLDHPRPSAANTQRPQPSSSRGLGRSAPNQGPPKGDAARAHPSMLSRCRRLRRASSCENLQRQWYVRRAEPSKDLTALKDSMGSSFSGTGSPCNTDPKA